MCHAQPCTRGSEQRYEQSKAVVKMTELFKLWLHPESISTPSTQEDHHCSYSMFHPPYFPFLPGPKQEIALTQIPKATIMVPELNIWVSTPVCVCVCT